MTRIGSEFKVKRLQEKKQVTQLELAHDEALGLDSLLPDEREAAIKAEQDALPSCCVLHRNATNRKTWREANKYCKAQRRPR